MESCFHDRYRECDEEAHLPGDYKQSGNKENVDENNSVYF